MSNTDQKPEPEKNEKGLVMITQKYCSALCEYNGYYYPPHLNSNLFLHYKGFRTIENLEAFFNIRVLYLENNCISKIENLGHMKSLNCLYLQNNYICQIENLENNTELVSLNLSGNKIKKIENLEALAKLENLYLEKNEIEEDQDIIGALSCPSLILLGLQNNKISENPEAIVEVFSKISKLRVLYLQGNEIIRLIPNYRRILISKLPSLTYLDDRPVKEEDRLATEAFFRGGFDEERKFREEYRNANDRVGKIRQQEKEMLKTNFEQRKFRALESLKLEYNKRKEELVNKKNKLLKDFEEHPNKRDELNVQLSSVDYQLNENEKYKIEEEKDVVLTISKRERTDQFCSFDYEDWMDEIVEMQVVDNFFDFSRALKLIQVDLKIRNVKNWELFNILDLRNKWTELELKKFRKGCTDEYFFSSCDNDKNIEGSSQPKQQEKEKMEKQEKIKEYNFQKSIDVKEEKIENTEFNNANLIYMQGEEEIVNTKIPKCDKKKIIFDDLD